MGSWQLHDAKNKFSRVIAEAKVAAQFISVRGRETAVVLSIDEYRRLTKPKTSLVNFLRASPLARIALEVERDEDVGREVEL
jgi:antitoxin Phd